MIIFFGPAGAGKSVQGQILAARHGWRWLSAGQMLRDTRDPEISAYLEKGILVPHDIINRVMKDAIYSAHHVDKIILDGFPRETEQIKWLLERENADNRKIDMVIVLEIPRQEILRRLHLRGRVDDTVDTIDTRLNIYRKEIYPILNLLNENQIPIAHLNGVGSVGQIHDMIEQELEHYGIIKEEQ